MPVAGGLRPPWDASPTPLSWFHITLRKSGDSNAMPFEHAFISNEAPHLADSTSLRSLQVRCGKQRTRTPTAFAVAPFSRRAQAPMAGLLSLRELPPTLRELPYVDKRGPVDGGASSTESPTCGNSFLRVQATADSWVKNAFTHSAQTGGTSRGSKRGGRIGSDFGACGARSSFMPACSGVRFALRRLHA